MPSLRHAILAAGALLALSQAADAATITSLYSTGVNNSGVALADGAVDTHYTVASYGSGPGSLQSSSYFQSYFAGYNSSWTAGGFSSTYAAAVYGTGTGSRYISYASNGGGGFAQFTYRTTFDLTGYNPASASITLQINPDDDGELALNGVLIPGSFDYRGQSLTVTITSGFVSGLNTLDFVTYNEGGSGGARIAVQSATVQAPEPGTIALLGTGLTGLVGLRRARRA